MDLKQIKELIEILEDSAVSEINIEDNENKINIKRGQVNTEKIQQPAIINTPEVQKESKEKKQSVEEEIQGQEITAPMVGTFYRCPAPDEPPFVKVGDTISEGETICIIEAMKLMNEIEADVSGEIVDILVEDGEPVEYGQTLFIVD